MRARALAIVIAFAFVSVLSATASASGTQATDATPSAMRPLDFLLGSWLCDTLAPVVPGEPPKTSTVVGTIKPTQGGAWYQWDAVRLPNSWSPQRALSQELFGGWNSTTHTFTAIYLDDRGSYGVETSTTAGFVDGHLRFTGPWTSTKGTSVFIEDFTVPEKGHFRNTISQKSGDTFIPAGTVDCYRR